MPEPESDCSELEHGEERRAEFVIARGEASEIFDVSGGEKLCPTQPFELIVGCKR